METWQEKAFNTEEGRRALAEERTILEATEAIAKAMKGNLITQTQLAKRLGVTKGRVTQILQGEQSMTLRTLARCAHAMGERVSIRFEAETE